MDTTTNDARARGGAAGRGLLPLDSTSHRALNATDATLEKERVRAAKGGHQRPRNKRWCLHRQGLGGERFGLRLIGVWGALRYFQVRQFQSEARATLDPDGQCWR